MAMIIAICSVDLQSQILFEDDFETGLAKWSNDALNTDNWARTTAYEYNGSWSLSNTTTSANQNNSIEVASNIDLNGGYSNVKLTFYHIAKTEAINSSFYDDAYVEYSIDGGSSYNPLPNSAYEGSANYYSTQTAFSEYSYTGTPDWSGSIDNSMWVKETFDLNAYLGEDDFRIRFRYTTDSGTEEDGWFIDDIKIENECAPVATFTKNCADDLTYSLSVEITDLKGAASVKITDGTIDYQTGINATGTYSINGLSGSRTYSIENESTPGCVLSEFISACTACDVLDTSFTSQSCQSDLTYDIDITIANLANGQTVKITDGTTDYFTGISSTGTYTIEDINQAATLSVVDEADAGCSKDRTYPVCQVCELADKPTDLCGSAPTLNLTQDFYGSTSCSYDFETSAGDYDPGGCGSMQNDSWMKFVAASDSVKVDWEITGGSSCGSGVQLAVFEGSCILENMTLLTGSCVNPTGPIGSSGRWEFGGLTIGDEYFVRIDGYAGDQCDYTFNPVGGAAISHPNDTIGAADTLFCGTTDTADIILASNSDAPSNCGGDATSKGMWYVFTGLGGNTTITTDDAQTNFNTRIRVFSGDTAVVDSLTCIGSDDDGGSGTTSSYTFLAANNQKYFIYVEGVGGDLGSFVISLNCCGLSVALENSENDSICPGDSITYYVTGGGDTFDFMIDGVSVQNGTDSFYTSAALTNGQIVSCGVIQGGCGANLTANAIVVKTPPNAIFTSNDSSICLGDTLVFTVGTDGFTNYEFIRNDINVQSGVDSFYQIISPNDGDVFKAVITNNGCSDTTSSITLSSNPLPDASLAMDDADSSICIGDQITFTANQAGLISYEILLNGTQVQIGSELFYTTDTLNHLDSVALAVIDNNGCTDTSDYIPISVNTLPSVGLSDDAIASTICFNEEITLTGTGASNYNFHLNSTSVQSGSSATFSTSSIENQDSFFVVGQDANGCVDTSITLTITVNNLPSATLTSSASGDSLCSSDTVEFIAGTGENYNFFLNNASVQNAALNTWSNSSISNGDELFVIVTNAENCSDTSNTLEMTVNSLPTALLNNNTSGDSICAGDTVDFGASGGDSYDFFVNGLTEQSGAETSFSTSVLTNQDIIGVVAIDENGCRDTSILDTIFVTTIPTTFLTNDATNNTICTGGILSFSASGATSYDYYLNDTLIVSNNANYSTDSLIDGDYVYVIGNTNGCLDTSNYDTVIVSNSITAQLSNNGSANVVCTGTIIHYTASGGDNYIFKINEVEVQDSSINTFSIPTDSISDGDIMEVIVSSGSGGVCVDSTINAMTVAPTPTADLSDDNLFNTLCIGDTVSFLATGGTNYNFLLNDSVSVQNGANANYITAGLSDQDRISVIVSNISNCADTTVNDTFTVNDLPSFVFGVDDSIICEGDSITFTTTGASNYEYFRNSSTAQDSSLTTYGIVNASQNDNIYVVVTDENFCVDTSRTISIDVNPNPTISLESSASGDSICSGELFTITDISAEGANYIFELNGAEVQVGTDTFYSSSSLSNLDQIMIIAETAAGCSDTQNVIVTVNSISATISSSDLDMSICQGDSFLLTASGGSQLDFHINSVSVQNSSDSTLSINNPNDSETYFVVASDSAHRCIDTSSTISITVNNNPTANLTSDAINDSSCAGEIVTFTENNQNGSNFEFFVNGVAMQNSASPEYLNNSLTAGDLVSVLVTTGPGCFATDTMSIFVGNVTAELSSTDIDGRICEGESVTFTATGGGDYQYMINALNVSTFFSLTTSNLNNGDIVSVAVSDQGCTEIVEIGPFTVDSYDDAGFFYDNPSYCASGATSPILDVPTTTGTWTATASGLAINSGTGELFLSSSTPGIYTVQFITDGVCSDSNTAVVQIQDALTEPLTQDDKTICNRTTTSISANSISVGSGTWSLLSGSATIADADDSITTINNLVPGQTVELIWTVDNGNICPSLYDTLRITNTDLPVIINAGADIFCYNDTLIIAAVEPAIAGSGTWSSSDPNIVFNNVNDAVTFITGTSPNSPLTLTWSVQDTFCLHDTSDAITLKNQYSTAQIIPLQDTSKILVEGGFRLDEADLTSFSWTIDDQELGSENPLSHTFYIPGDHVIEVNGLDDQGCFFTGSINYPTVDYDWIYVPEVFTPNADGNNDGISPMGYLVDSEDYYFAIFDRWGNKVFESNIAHEEWDGNNMKNGKPCINDGYSWYFSCTDANGQEHTDQGIIILFR